MAITVYRTGGILGFRKGAGRFNVKPQVQSQMGLGQVRWVFRAAPRRWQGTVHPPPLWKLRVQPSLPFGHPDISFLSGRCVSKHSPPIGRHVDHCPATRRRFL